MKKIYNAPNTLLVKIRPNHLMQASLDIGDTVTDASGAEGRRSGSGWDDDDYDDYDE